MNAGQNNLEEMKRAVEAACVFVFVISPQVPKDCFSFFEADCAQYKKIRDKDLQILVWPIKGASFRDAPEWMQKYFSIPREYSVADVGREIASLTTDYLRAKDWMSPIVYYGREDTERQIIIDINAKRATTGKPVNVAVLSGLNGSGRRTFAQNLMASQYPALRRTSPHFDLPSSAEAVDLYIALMADLSNGLSLERMADLREHFPIQPERQAEFIFNCLNHWMDMNVPVVVNMRWGLLDASGALSPWCAALVKLYEKSGAGGFLVFVSGRRVRPENVANYSNVVNLQLPTLTQTAVNFILSKLIQPEFYNPLLIDGLARLSAGHPDTARHIAYLVNQGRPADTILLNKEIIFAFKDKIFEDLLAPGFLDDFYHQILQLICWYPQLDTRLIHSVFGQVSQPELVKILWELSDYSLIERTQHDTYRVNQAARSTLVRQPEILSAETKAKLAELVQDMLGRDDLVPEQIEPMILAFTDSEGDLPPLLSAALTPSTLFSVVERHYDQGRGSVSKPELERNMRIASQLAALSLPMAMSADLLESTLYYGCDALIRIGHDPEPLAKEMALRGFGSVHLIRGSSKFHREGDDAGAVEELKIAIDSKKFRLRSIRLLARIQMRMGRAASALETLEKLRDFELFRDSGFLVQKIRVLRALRRHPEANDLEEKLKAVGDDHGDLFVFEASRLVRRGDYPNALKMVDKALAAPKVNKPPLITLRCSIELMNGDMSNLTTACSLAESSGRPDDACELRARAALIGGDWRRAERELESIRIYTWYTWQIEREMLAVKANDPIIKRDVSEVSKVEKGQEEALRRMVSAFEVRF